MTHPHTTLIQSKIDDFHPLPATVTKVLAVTSNPKSSAHDLIEAILPDQTMCSAILKAANSAFFGIPREVSTIERAVVVLGYEEIKNIVIGKTIFSSLPKIPRETRETVTTFWDHAFTCGLAAKIIAEQLRLSPSELFIAGLLHDIGKIAMLLAFPNEYQVLRDLTAADHGNFTAEEKTRFGISHDEAGLRLTRKWLLPEQLMMAAGYHHSPQSATGCNEHPLIVQAADILSLIYCSRNHKDTKEVERIFAALFPEIGPLWQRYGLPWQPENLGPWYEKLLQYRENEQGLLSLFSSP